MSKKNNGWNSNDSDARCENENAVSVPPIDRETIREWYAADRIRAVRGYREDVYANHKRAQSAELRRTSYFAMAGFSLNELKSLILKAKKKQWLIGVSVLFPDISIRTLQRYMATANALADHELDHMVFCSIGRERLLKINSSSKRRKCSILELLEDENIDVPIDTSNKQHIVEFKLSIDAMLDREKGQRSKGKRKKPKFDPNDIFLEDDPPVGAANRGWTDVGENDNESNEGDTVPHVPSKNQSDYWTVFNALLESGHHFVQSAKTVLGNPDLLSSTIKANPYAGKKWLRLMKEISDTADSLAAAGNKSSERRESESRQTVLRMRRKPKGSHAPPPA